MASGDHTQRSILFGAFVEMQTDGEHRFEDFGGRFDACGIFTSNHAILMPWHFPVRVRALVEKRRVRRDALR
jgi:hypothetical protein